MVDLPCTPMAHRHDLVDDRLLVAGRVVGLQRPRDPEALLDEEAFEHEEFLPYWAELWPSAIGLAEAVGARGDLTGLRVLELGCGLGVPSLVAALAGADVLATDWSPDAVALLQRNAALTGARLRTACWSWTTEASALGGPWDLVLGADLLYERRNGRQLLAALPGLVADGGEAWIADPGRATAEDFLEAAARAWDRSVVEHDGPASVVVHRLRAAGGADGVRA